MISAGMVTGWHELVGELLIDDVGRRTRSLYRSIRSNIALRAYSGEAVAFGTSEPPLKIIEQSAQLTVRQFIAIKRMQAEMIETRLQLYRIGCGDPRCRPIAGLPPHAQRSQAFFRAGPAEY